MQAIILNDTTRNKGHLGCQLVMQNIRQACQKQGIDILASYQQVNAYDATDFTENCQKADVVILNGEGTLHHDQPQAIELLKTVLQCKKYDLPVALINTVWQDNLILNDYINQFDLICTRESFSATQIKALNPTATLLTIPDMSFYSADKPHTEPTGKLLVVDSVAADKTRALLKYALKKGQLLHIMADTPCLTHKPAFNFLQQQLEFAFKTLTLSSFEGVSSIVTGRFHTMCLAMKYGIPFRVLASNTHKIQGVLTDAGVNPADYIIDKNALPKLPAPTWPNAEDAGRIQHYAHSATEKIDTMFNQVKQLAA